MGIIKSISDYVNGAIEYMSEKKRRFDKISRIKRRIKQETSSVVKGYIVLGKHYYKELRGVPNKEMQRVCSTIDDNIREIEQLRCKLEEIKNGCDIKFYCDNVGDTEFCNDLCCDDDGASCSGSYCDCEPICNCGDQSYHTPSSKDVNGSCDRNSEEKSVSNEDPDKN